MKKTPLIVLIFTLFATSIWLVGKKVNQLEWLTNLEEALKIAKQKDRSILINFTGSDWCYWCKKLDDEIFSQKEFIEYANDHLVPVIIDFPRKIKLPPEMELYNRNLADRYGITGFPTVLLLDSDGKLIEQTGYLEGGANKYVEHLETIFAMNSGEYNMFENLDFTLTDIDGNEITLSKIGGFIILDFWATWCDPCRAQITYLQQFSDEFKTRGLTVVGVSNEPSDIQKQFIKEMAEEGIIVNYIMLIDKGQVITSKYKIKGIPVTYFIAPDGKLIKKETGFNQELIEDFRKELEEHLSK